MKDLNNCKCFRLFDELDRQGMTQSEFAERIGASTGNISDWAAGKSSPSRRKWQVISEVLGKPAKELRGWSEETSFWKNFVKQCELKEKYPSLVVEELGFNKSVITSWKNGSLPRVAGRKKVADYFGITVDELMDEPQKPLVQGKLSQAWPDVEKAFESASPEVCEMARAAALAVLESGKKQLTSEPGTCIIKV